MLPFFCLVFIFQIRIWGLIVASSTQNGHIKSSTGDDEEENGRIPKNANDEFEWGHSATAMAQKRGNQIYTHGIADQNGDFTIADVSRRCG